MFDSLMHEIQMEVYTVYLNTDYILLLNKHAIIFYFTNQWLQLFLYTYIFVTIQFTTKRYHYFYMHKFVYT